MISLDLTRERMAFVPSREHVWDISLISWGSAVRTTFRPPIRSICLRFILLIEGSAVSFVIDKKGREASETQ